mgnify:CR=1 FL=1
MRKALIAGIAIAVAAVFAIVALMSVMTGCSDMTEGSDENMQKWFSWATEQTLPDQAKFVAGRNISGWLGDIYLIVDVPTEYAEVLDQKLTRETEPLDLPVTDSLKQYAPGVASLWKVDGRTGLLYYSHQTGTVDDGGWISQIAFDRTAGRLYCHFSEYAP